LINVHRIGAIAVDLHDFFKNILTGQQRHNTAAGATKAAFHGLCITLDLDFNPAALLEYAVVAVLADADLFADRPGLQIFPIAVQPRRVQVGRADASDAVNTIVFLRGQVVPGALGDAVPAILCQRELPLPPIEYEFQRFIHS